MPRRRQRDPKRERYWRRTMRAWERSGESIRGFCAEQGLTETAFHAWRRELRKRDGEREGGAAGRRRARSRGQTRRGRTAAPSRFLPVQVASAGVRGPASIEIERDGTTIRLHGAVEAEVLARILEAVRRGSC